MNRTKRWSLYTLLIVLFVGLTVEIPIIAAGILTKPAPADVMIVLGARLIGREPSLILRLRLDETAALYRRGYAPAIIVSGGRGLDEAVSEAEAMRDYLVQHGVAADQIWLEDTSVNTYQNLANSRAIMERQGYRRAIIVSNASHIRRSLAIARQLGMEVTAAPAPMADNLYLTVKQYLREGAAMLAQAAE